MAVIFTHKSTKAIEASKKGLWQVDTIDLITHKYNGFQHVVTLIDIFSKKAFAFPIKDKTAASVWNAVEELIETEKPSAIQFDNGTEFKGIVKERVEGLGITYFNLPPRTPTSNSVVERFNGTFKSQIWAYMEAQKKKDWPSQVERIVNQYNDAYHTAIKMTPNELYAKNGEEVNDFNANRSKKKIDKTKDEDIPNGTLVCVAKDRSKVVVKKGESRWMDAVFRIEEQIKGKGLTSRNRYKIVDNKTERALQGLYNKTDLFIIKDIQSAPGTEGRRNSPTRRRIDQRKVEELERIQRPRNSQRTRTDTREWWQVRE